MSSDAFAAVVLGGALVAATVLSLPVIVAIVRDIDGKVDIAILALLFGWTGVAWTCALILALTRPRRERARVTPADPPFPKTAARTTYRDGIYLISAGADSHTWAVHSAGGWRIVYEAGGVERLASPVREDDVPLGVLAEALDAGRS